MSPDAEERMRADLERVLQEIADREAAKLGWTAPRVTLDPPHAYPLLDAEAEAILDELREYLLEYGPPGPEAPL